MAEQIKNSNGSTSKGNLQDLLNLINAQAPTVGELCVWCVDEGGIPCTILERVGLACAPSTLVDWNGGDTWNVERLGSGRFQVTSTEGVDVAPIGNPSKRSFANGSDFLKAFFSFGHLWPLGEAFSGMNATGRWEWAIPNAVGQLDNSTIVEDLSDLAIENAGNLASSIHTLSFLDASFAPKTFEERETIGGVTVYRQGRALVLSVRWHSSDGANAPSLASNYSDPFTTQAVSSFFAQNPMIDGQFFGDAVFNGFAWSGGQLWPCYVEPDSYESFSMWTPAIPFTAPVFE